MRLLLSFLFWCNPCPHEFGTEPARDRKICALMQVDAEVAAEKAAERQAVIERVNKLLFSETDKVKGFHGAALHCDVLAERAAQVEFAAQTRAQRAAQEAAFVQQQQEQLELAERAEVARLAAAKAAAAAQRDAQLEQLEEVKASIRAERAAAAREV